MENNNRERTSLWVIAGRVVFTVALIACIWFIFSNSMAVATVSTGSSGRVLALDAHYPAPLGSSGTG
ncbi:MAG: hypothetical protein ACLT9S_11205 [Faecalibacterium sp.]